MKNYSSFSRKRIFYNFCFLVSHLMSSHPMAKIFIQCLKQQKKTIFSLHCNLFHYLLFLQQTHVLRAIHKNSATNFTMIEHLLVAKANNIVFSMQSLLPKLFCYQRMKMNKITQTRKPVILFSI